MNKDKDIQTEFKVISNRDFEVRSLDEADSAAEQDRPIWFNLNYFAAGILFGILLVKSEVISWFRIQEMFRFQSFHMYGVIGSAVMTGMISVFIIKRLKLKSLTGEPITFYSRKFNKGNIYGGLLFGCGWALTGACPGPLFAQLGTGALATIVTLFSAIAGTWVYGLISEKLPH
jgi:uncharacterized protein